jgi:hypothetical protein
MLMQIGTMTLQSVSLARIQDAVETVAVIASGLGESNVRATSTLHMYTYLVFHRN